MIDKIRQHLKDNNMSYFEHAKFSGMLAIRFAKMSFGAVIHAFMPCYFETYSSDCVKNMYRDFASKR